MSNLASPKAVFFDWDGTLADSLAFLESVHDYALGVMGMAPRDAGWFQPYFGMPRDVLYRDIYGARSEEAKPVFEAHLRKQSLDKLKQVEGAAKLLEYVYARNIPMGIVTNKKRYFIEPEIAHFAWGHYFKTLVCAGEAQDDKPGAAPLLMAIEQAQLGLDPDDIWYVGDTRADMECAHEARVKMIYLDHLGRDNEWAERFVPALRVKNCAELRQFLLQCPEN